MLDDKTIVSLISHAKYASLNSYSPYSGFRVGAAILASNGNIFVGCNVEFSDYLALHAEVNAIGSAVVNGETSFKAVCVFSYSSHPVLPCGSCRQKLAEFASASDSDILIIAANDQGNVVHRWLSNLLPDANIPVKKRSLSDNPNNTLNH